MDAFVVDSPLSELTMLRERVRELERRLADVTRTEREQSARLRDFMECTPGIFFESQSLPTDERPRPFRLMSPKTEAILGYTAEEMTMSPELAYETMHDDDRDGVLRAVLDQFASGGIATYTYRQATKDGRYRWLEAHVVTVTRDDGAPAGMRGVALDITRYKETEHKLAQALAKAQDLSQRLEGLIKAVPGFVFEIFREEDEARGRCNYVSPQVEAITGVRYADLGQSVDRMSDLIHPADHERAMRETMAIYSKKEGGRLEFRIIAKGGRVVWLEAHVVPIVDEAGSAIGLRGVCIDVSERVRANEERERLQSEVIRAKDRLLEELSTPLIPITNDVVVMPLIGTIDKERADRIVEALLHGLGKARAKVAILDITGVAFVDGQIVDALLRAARAAQMLGAKVLLTGIRPEVAQTMVAEGADLRGIITAGTLESGIRYATRTR